MHGDPAMADDINQLIRAAETAVNSGKWNEAEDIWREVRRRDPANPKASFSLGVHAMRDRDFIAACDYFEEARRTNPRDPFLLLTLSKARRERGDDGGEAEAIEAALAADPYFMPAILAKAAWMERHGAVAPAAMFYRTALQLSPPEPQWAAALRPQLLQARDFVAANARKLSDAFNTALAPALDGLSPEKAERWREAASIMAGQSTPYRQEANQLYVPRLPAIPFYDRKLFPWADAIERKTDIIREELKTALAKDGKEFSPYIKLRPGQPVDQWQDLNHSTRWSHYGLWRNGEPVEAHLAQCPETRKALEAIDMADIGGLCPNAMFSALAPHTEIPPHTGETNARLTVHLPLVVPEKCTYRVGFEHRTWKEGELLIFDDTIEHTARNDSDELRVVLIFDVWNPLLDPDERAAVKALAAAWRQANVV